MLCKACTETLRRRTNGKRSLEFPWFGGSRQTMSLTATSALFMWLGSTERTGAASSILIFNQHVVLIVMKFLCLSSENFLTLVTKVSPVLKDMKTKKKWFLKMMLHIHFPKRSWMILFATSACQRTLPNCWHPDWRKKKLLSDSARISFFRNRYQEYLCFFLYSEGVLCRYCAASVQAWGATVRTQRLETVHWQQQVITEMCSATQRQPVCLCAHCSLDYTEGEVWSGKVCAGENWLWSA